MNRKYIDFVPKTKIESNEPVVKMPDPAEISLAADGSVRPVRRRGMADIMRPRREVVTGAPVEEVRHEVVETIDFDDEGNELDSQQVEYDTLPEFKGSTEKEDDELYHYEFVSWDKEIAKVSGDTTYVAKYNNKFITNDKKILRPKNV